MSGEPGRDGAGRDGLGDAPGRDELLDNTPEAVAMRRARAARAEAAAREAAAAAPPRKPWGRRVLLGAIMGGVALVGVLGRMAGSAGP